MSRCLTRGNEPAGCALLMSTLIYSTVLYNWRLKGRGFATASCCGEGSASGLTAGPRLPARLVERPESLGTAEDDKRRVQIGKRQVGEAQ